MSQSFKHYSKAEKRSTKPIHFRHYAYPGLYDANGVLLVAWTVTEGASDKINIVSDFDSPSTAHSAALGVYRLSRSAYPTTTKIIIPNDYTRIGAYSFSNCDNILNAELPDGLIYIGIGAFQDASNLVLTELPSGIAGAGIASGKGLHASAFRRCTNLALTSLPSGITTIEQFTFQDCTNLALTALPSGITKIGYNAFQNCTNMPLTEIPDGIKGIYAYAFQNCTNLALTSLPSSQKSYLNATGPDGSNYAFQNCTSLALTSLPSTITNLSAQYLFDGCTSLALTELPPNLTIIGSYTFRNCSSLALTSLPSTLTTIGTSVFAGCTSLKNMEITKRLGAGTKIFDGCTGLEKVWFRSTCTSVTASSAANAPFVNCSDTLQIYCEADSKPSGYGTYFNRTGTNGATTVTVVYGQTTRPW